jgi:hypothetical protein
MKALLQIENRFVSGVLLPAGDGRRILVWCGGAQGGDDLAVAPSLAGVRGVCFQQDACFQLLSRRVFSLPDHRINGSRSSSLSVTTYFLTAITFLATNPLRCWDGTVESETDRGIKDGEY